jgi:citrate/tricarballylate utilization protein
VILGIVGGIALIIGAGGLFWIQWTKSDRAPAEKKTYTLDYAFLAILAITPFTGLLTMLLRTTSALGTALVAHLAFVAALFITMPYEKFVHFVYRTLALVSFEMEGGARIATPEQRAS